MTTTALRRLGDDSGAAAVEFAVILPVFVLIVVGIIEFGQVYNKQISLSAAAREGVRVMAIRSSNPATSGTADADARSATIAAAPTVTDPALASADISFTPSTCLGQPSGTSITLLISYTHPFDTPFFGATIPLQSRGVMQCAS